ncbi:MAG TPA: hypothetical protein VMB22_01975 [Verrucomicrobiae bacterium]|nr:hypothetical protein [Verrucomicrobiae bacterium]
MNSSKFLAINLFAIGAALFVSGCVSMKPEAQRPMLSVLDQFEHAPATGLDEAPMPERALPTNSITENWPGKGLAEHPFLYYGEGNNVLYVVNHGRVVWAYALPRGGEIDDAWMLSNGHIVCTKMTDCYEITPEKEIVWHYHCPTNAQVHSLQPIGLDKVAIVENGLPPHFYIVNKVTGEIVMSHELPTFTNSVKSIHTQFRNCRVTAQGTYLIGNLDNGTIDEYDRNWKLIWHYDAIRPWSEVRLKNGDTLIPGDNRGFVHEVNPKCEIVWAIETNSLPGIALHDVQTADRLANGDTIICNRGGSNKTLLPPQVIEVTPDKKVVWVLQDYKDLPSCTGIQLLDQPGLPEILGDLER